MDTKSSKIELAKLILELEDPKLIGKIYALLLNVSSRFKKSLTEDEHEEIKFGLDHLNRGERISLVE